MSGGAGVEWLFGYKFAHDDIHLEDFRSRDHMWDLTRRVIDFFERYLPFVEMNSADPLTSRDDDYCLAKPGAVYAIYLPRGGSTDLQLPAGHFQVRWFNPRSGGSRTRARFPKSAVRPMSRSASRRPIRTETGFVWSPGPTIDFPPAAGATDEAVVIIRHCAAIVARGAGSRAAGVCRRRGLWRPDPRRHRRAGVAHYDAGR